MRCISCQSCWGLKRFVLYVEQKKYTQNSFSELTKNRVTIEAFWNKKQSQRWKNLGWRSQYSCTLYGSTIFQNWKWFQCYCTICCLYRGQFDCKWETSSSSWEWKSRPILPLLMMGFYYLYTWVLFILNLITHLKFHIIWAISYMAYNIITILYGLYPNPLFISFPAINNSNPSQLYHIY